MPRRDNQFSTSAMKKEILDLQSQLSEKETHLLRLESSLVPCSGPGSSTSSTSDSEEWQTKYERLVEAHKNLQRINMSLEEKLLKVVDKFETDKNIISRDLSTQTQKVVEAKFTIQQLHKQNNQLKSDLQIALNLLQMKPDSFMHQKIDSLPEDLQVKVKQYSTQKSEDRRKEQNCGQKITVSLTSEDQSVSAAILAKVLQERENERKSQQTFRIDIGTQTHGWQFPDNFGHSVSSTSIGPRPTTNRNITSEDPNEDQTYDKNVLSKRVSLPLGNSHRNLYPYSGHVSNILLASVIQPPPQNINQSKINPNNYDRSAETSYSPEKEQEPVFDHYEGRPNPTTPPKEVTRSVSCYAEMQYCEATKEELYLSKKTNRQTLPAAAQAQSRSPSDTSLNSQSKTSLNNQPKPKKLSRTFSSTQTEL